MQLIEIAGFLVIEVEQIMSWDKAMALPAKANTEAIGGFTDWVLPDKQTLAALAAFKPEKSWFWSSSPSAEDSNNAWYVYFGNGYVGYDHKLDCLQVHLVRAEQIFEIGRAGQLESMRQAGIQLPENIS